MLETKLNTPPMVVCYGEILWDILPSAVKPGGAPMNVAYHLRNMGIDTHLISRIGKDQKGNELIDLLKSWHLSTDYCQIDSELPTSEVHAIIGSDNEVKYDILYPVAWDHITFQDEYTSLIGEADALVFGSLSSRDLTSRNTLFKLLEMSKFNVLDINLREPHFSPKMISDLLKLTDLLKLNASELNLVTSWFKNGCKTEIECVSYLQDQYNIKEIIVTKGGNGASYHTQENHFDYPSFKIKVADTVGAGDAFLAAFLSKKLKNEHIDDAMSYASALGAFVTMHNGACPNYSLTDLESFRNSKVTFNSSLKS